MKPNSFLTFTALLMICIPVLSQKPIRVTEDSLKYGAAKYPGFSISIPEVSYERTEKSWIKELQSGTKSKVVNENGDMSIFGANIKDISATPMNIYSRLESRDSLVMLMVSFEVKKDQYIQKANNEAELIAAKEYLKQFAKSEYMNLVKGQLQDEEKKLRDLNNDLNSLKNDKSRMERSIQSNRSLIKEMQDNIVLQNTELSKVSAELVNENNLLTSMDEGAAKEEKASYVKDLEKRKKKISNEIESSENKIKKANNEIDEADRNIPKNEADQEDMRSKVAQQEAVVNRFTQKLNTIKAY
ncbi:MAG TPA: hypothetical protein VK179_10540 [Bacteroidales bacterium]|nr:hypothetical protein [Bacteroidales bacterium]